MNPFDRHLAEVERRAPHIFSGDGVMLDAATLRHLLYDAYQTGVVETVHSQRELLDELSADRLSRVQVV